MEKSDRWLKALRDAGHTPYVDEDGQLDYFALDHGYHNGPGCQTCRKTWCWHCVSEATIKWCSANPGKAE